MATVTKLQSYGNQIAVLFSDGSRVLATPNSSGLLKVAPNPNDLFTLEEFGNLVKMTFSREIVFAYPTIGGLWYVAPNLEPTPPAPDYYWPFEPSTWNMNNGFPGDNFRTSERPNHNGMDMGYGIANTTGTPVKAIGGGVVIHAEFDSGYGNRVIVEHHGNAHRSTYNHFNTTPYVTVGQAVVAGDVLGGIGNTGNSFGNHLHFEIFDIAVGDYIDPLIFMATYNPDNLVVP